LDLGDYVMNKTTVTIIGSGLGGLTAAEYLKCYADVVILEQGKEYRERTDGKSDEVLIGIGGAGTLSGGKLCFPPASSGIWNKTRHLMPAFYSFRADMSAGVNSFMTISPASADSSKAMPQKYYNTELVLQDSMRVFLDDRVKRLRDDGVVIRSRCRVDKVLRRNENYEITYENEYGEQENLHSNYVIVATGRTSVPFLKTLFAVDRHHQPDLGIRISIDTAQPAFARVGADIKIKRQIKDYLVRTFCVCCGGNSIKTSTRGLVHYDGHFTNDITGITNLGILARSPNCSGITVTEHYLRSMQQYVDKEISLRDFMKYHSVLAKDSPYEELFEVLVAFVTELYRNGCLFQNADEVPVMLPAIDNTNPLINTDLYFESNLQNVFVIGDAAGVSRGFIQAMWSGYCASERIIEKIVCEGMKNQGIQTA
jgi:hypothetical protein